MRHLVKDKKLGRSGSHREALMASLVCNLIAEKRITTTLPKAREARRLAEKMVTTARKGTLAARRRALAVLRQEKHVVTLFDDIAPRYTDRPGGYTRILKTGQRPSDGSEMAILEWVDMEVPDKKRKKKAEGEKAA
jgi:large subunit ribosomal protein L17